MNILDVDVFNIYFSIERSPPSQKKKKKKKIQALGQKWESPSRIEHIKNGSLERLSP